MRRFSISIRLNQRGQTLIELMAALFVITTGLLGVLGLTTANVRSETTAVMRLTAFNLAREGAELARNIRDSNWLSGRAWDTGLTLTSHCAILSTAPSAESFQHFEDASLCTADRFDDTYRIYTALGVYTQYADTTSIPSVATAMQYYRRILLDPICLDKTQSQLDDGISQAALETVKSDGGCDSTSHTMIGMQVTSEVAWHIGGREQFARIIERFYNWR